jgi:hypothetical protein
VLGLVTTKRGEFDDRDVLVPRIEEASRDVDLDQLCLSPRCGFSSMVEGKVLTREQQADRAAARSRGCRRGVGLTAAGAARYGMSFTERLCGSRVSAPGLKVRYAIVRV